MKTISDSSQTYYHISYVHIYTHTRLQNKIIYIPVKNKVKKTNLRKIQHDLLLLRGAQRLS